MKKTLPNVFSILSPFLGISCAVVFLLLNAVLSFAQTDNWQQMGVLVTARTGAIGFGIGNKGYISSGYDSAGNYKNDLWEFDINSKSWSQKANFGGNPRTGATGFSMDGKGYVGTGHNGNIYYNDFWEYNPVTNSWSQKANVGGGARSNATGFSVSGIQGGSKGYIGTGVDNAGALKNDFWEYDPVNDVWAQKSNFPGGARAGATSFSQSTVGFLGTGYDGEGNYKNDFWMYSAAIDIWSQKANFGGSPRSGATGFSLTSLSGTKGYIMNGLAEGNNYLNDFWEYDPMANTWTQKSNFSGGARSGAICFSSSSPAFAYVGTGSGPTGYFNDLWQYDGFSWTKQPSFGGVTARSRATSFGIGSKGYVGTGVDSAGALKKDFWEYDPAAGTWTQLADFGGTARDVATGFSIGSKGYIGTGFAYDNNFKNDFWEYDPATNTWTQKANFGGLGRMGAAGFSIGNKGYIGTGTYRTQSINDFWEYDPATDTWTRKANFAGTARENATGFSISDKGYIGLGGINDFWEYDPVMDEWTQKTNFGGGARTTATGFGIGNKGYVGLGGVNDFWEYNPVMDSWTQKTNFIGGARTAATGFSTAGKGYIAFGSAADGLKNDLWEYTPAGIATPVTFISVKAYQENKLVTLAWTAAEDYDTKEYLVEKSRDGIHFKMAGTQAAGSNGQAISYKWIDREVTGAVNYYRVKAVSTNGEIIVSQIVKVFARSSDYISIFPNPVTSGVVTLYISNKKKENYRVRLYNEPGQLIASYTISHPGGTSSNTIYLPYPALKSFYILNIERGNGQQETFRLYFAR